MKLFIDDLRSPPDSSWTVVRSSHDAINIVTKRGFPNFISFDHDLGGDDTSMVFLNTLIDFVLDGTLKIPDDFEYSIHSANPVGVENIRSKLDSFMSFLKVEKGC